MVERLHDYLERSFLPGRRFASPQDFNTQLRPGWWSGQPAPAAVPWAVARRIGSTRIGRRCWRCRRCRRRPGGGTRCGCRGITTCAWTATTTRCIRRRSAAGSMVRADLDRVRVCCDGRWSPTMTGSGRNTKPSPIRRMWWRPGCCAGSGSTSCRRPAQTEVEQRRLADYDTALGSCRIRRADGVMAARPKPQPRRDRRAGVSDPGVESAHAARGGGRLAERARAEILDP